MKLEQTHASAVSRPNLLTTLYRLQSEEAEPRRFCQAAQGTLAGLEDVIGFGVLAFVS